MLTGRFTFSAVSIPHDCSLHAILDFHKHENLVSFCKQPLCNKFKAATVHEIYLRPQENHTEQNGPKFWSLLRVESSEGARQYESECQE